MELCELVQRNSRRVWDTLRKARGFKMQFGEESITDFWVLNMMSDIEKLKPMLWGLDVHTFIKQEESINGADWELWLTGSSRKWLGIRVQAKILNFECEKFKQLRYSIDSKDQNRKGNRQLDSLIDKAEEKNLIPLYCMYSNWPRYPIRRPITCYPYQRDIGYYYGTPVLNPYDVRKMDKIKSGVNLDRISEQLIPLHCIFCCTKFSKHDLPTRALDYLWSWIPKDNHDYIDEKSKQKPPQKDDFLKERPPEYVEGLASDRHYSFIEDGNFMEDKELKRVIVLKEHESRNRDK